MPIPVLLYATFPHYNCNLLPLSSFNFGFSRQGSPNRIFHLHLVLSSASSSVTSTTAMSSLNTSIYVLLVLPRFLFPGSSILSIIVPIHMHVQTTSVLPLMFSLQSAFALIHYSFRQSFSENWNQLTKKNDVFCEKGLFSSDGSTYRTNHPSDQRKDCLDWSVLQVSLLVISKWLYGFIKMLV